MRDRYGADNRSRKSALSAWYLAAARLVSEPNMTTLPLVVHTRHLHMRPRLFKSTSKIANRGIGDPDFAKPFAAHHPARTAKIMQRLFNLKIITCLI
jgi:hypothetical protein